MGTYYTVSAPVTSEGFFFQPESRVTIGTEALWGSLETGTFSYSAYSAAIGLQSGKSVELGELEALGFSHVPTFTAVESANVRTSNIYVLESEETTVTVGIREFKPETLLMAIGTGTMYYPVADEVLITFGDACDIINRPLVIESSDISCQVPAAEDIATGVSGAVVTLYDTFVTSGLPWDDMTARNLNVITLEFTCRPVFSLPLGNRIGNIYLF
jgi:hypothetical protein